MHEGPDTTKRRPRDASPDARDTSHGTMLVDKTSGGSDDDVHDDSSGVDGIDDSAHGDDAEVDSGADDGVDDGSDHGADERSLKHAKKRRKKHKKASVAVGTFLSARINDSVVECLHCKKKFKGGEKWKPDNMERHWQKKHPNEHAAVIEANNKGKDLRAVIKSLAGAKLQLGMGKFVLRSSFAMAKMPKLIKEATIMMYIVANQVERGGVERGGVLLLFDIPNPGGL